MPNYVRIKKPEDAELEAFRQDFKQRFQEASGKGGADFRGLKVDRKNTHPGTILSLRFRGKLSEKQERVVQDLKLGRGAMASRRR